MKEKTRQETVKKPVLPVVVGFGSIPQNSIPNGTEDLTFRDGKDLILNLLNNNRAQEVVLKSLLVQLTNEGSLAYPPLLASYLTVSPEMEDLLQIWTRVRTNAEDRVVNMDSLILEIFQLVITQLAARTDLGELAGGEALKLTSPIPLAKAIIHRHMAYLRFYLSGDRHGVISLALRLLTTINGVALSVAKENLALLNLPDTALDSLLAYTPAPVPEDVMDADYEDLELKQYREIRESYLGFCVSFLESTDLTTRTSFLSQGILNRFTKWLHIDEQPTLARYLKLITLLAQPQAKLTWTSLLSLIDLPLLNKCLAIMKSAHSEGIVSIIFEFLVEVCTYPGKGVCFRDGGWYPRERRGDDRRLVNGLLSSFLMSLRPSESKHHQSLVLGILEASPALASLYWTTCQLSLDPRLSTRWLSNMVLLQRTIQLPVPRLDAPSGANQVTPSFTSVVDAILPVAFDRAIQSKCLQSKVQLVRYFGSLVLLASFTKLDIVLETINTHIQTNLQGANSLHAPAWKKLVGEVSLEVKRRLCDFRAIVSLHKVTSQDDLLMSQLAPRLLKAYQRHMPDLVLQCGVALDKLMPTNLKECHPAAQARALELLLHLPDFKWWGSDNGPSPALSLVQVYIQGVHVSLQNQACRGLHQFLGPSLLFQHDPSELSVWLNAFSLLLPIFPSLGPLLDRSLSLTMTYPYKYIDATLALPSPALEWVAPDETRILPFSPLLLALKDAAASEKEDLVPAATILLARVATDLAIHSSRPGFAYSFLQECEGSVPSELAAPLVLARCHIGALIGVSDPSPIAPLLGSSIKESLEWEENQVLDQLDLSLESCLPSQVGGSFLTVLDLSERFPNLLVELQRKLAQFLARFGVGVLSQAVLCAIKGKSATLLLSRLPPNLLASAIHPSALGHPLVGNLIIKSATDGDQGHSFLARSVLGKLQQGLWGGQVDVEGGFILLEEVVATSPETLVAILNHPLLDYAFLHKDQLLEEASFVRRLNFNLARFLSSLSDVTKSLIPSSFFSRVIAAVHDFVRLAQHNPSVSGLAPILVDLIAILPISSIEELAGHCLSDPKVAFSSPRLAQLAQSLLAALSASPEGSVASGKLVASHLQVLTDAWLARPTLLLDNALVQALEVLVPHAKLFLESRVDIGHAKVIHASLAVKFGPNLESIISSLFGASAHVALSPERIRMVLFLITANKSLRLHFCQQVLAAPEVLSLSLRNSMLSFESLTLVMTFLAIHNLMKCPESQAGAQLMASAALPFVLEAFKDSSSIDRLTTTLACLEPSGWDSFVAWVSSHDKLTSQLADALRLGLTNSKVAQLSRKFVLQVDVVPRELCYGLSKLLVESCQGEPAFLDVASLIAQSALRYQDANALEQLNRFFSNVSVSEDVGILLVEATLSAFRDLEITTKLRNAGISLMHLIFKSTPSAVCSAGNMESLAAIYTARYTRQDRQILEMLIHIEAHGHGSIRRVGLLWGTHRARFSSWEVQDMMFKGTIAQESISTLDPTVMRETIACMPLPGLSLDPASALVDPSGFKEKADCYDPLFLLPLFKQWLAFGRHLNMSQFVRRLNLGLLLTCLSSPDTTLRMVAYHLLDDIYLQVETASFVERHQLLTLLQVVKNVVESRATTPLALPCVLTQFAASATSIVMNPSHSLYRHINLFLVERPLLSSSHLPMFVNSFNTFSKTSGQERTWLLKVMAKGLRIAYDLPLYSRCHAFTILMSYYHSPPPDVKEACDHQLPILEIFFWTAINPQFAATLLGDFGGLNFLASVARAKTWSLGPMIALRLAYHLILNSDMRVLSWKLSSWPQALLTLIHDALSQPDHGIAVVEASLRITSFLLYAAISNPSLDLTILKPLMGTIFTKACLILEFSEPFLREFGSQPRQAAFNSEARHAPFSDFEGLMLSPQEDISQLIRHFHQAITFGLEIIGQLTTPLALSDSLKSNHWKFLISRSLVLSPVTADTKETNAVNWVLDLP